MGRREGERTVVVGGFILGRFSPILLFTDGCHLQDITNRLRRYVGDDADWQETRMQDYSERFNALRLLGACSDITTRRHGANSFHSTKRPSRTG